MKIIYAYNSAVSKLCVALIVGGKEGQIVVSCKKYGWLMATYNDVIHIILSTIEINKFRPVMDYKFISEIFKENTCYNYST